MSRRALVLPLLPLAIVLLGMIDPPVTLYLAGDSTMAQKLAGRRPETGWGEKLQQYFDIDQVRVENYARNGRSTRTFISEGRWQAIVDRLRPGDYVFVQFGHNDESPDKVDRYTPPDDFRRNLARFVTDVHHRKATPVLLTPVQRRKFDAAGNLVDTHGQYSDLVRAVAAELHVPLIDLQQRSGEILARYGADGSRQLFLQLAPAENPNYPQGVQDNTHFSPLGAELVARAAAEGIAALDMPLAKLVRLPAPSAAAAAAPSPLPAR